MTLYQTEYCALCPYASECISKVRKTFRKRLGQITPIVYQYFEGLLEGISPNTSVLDFGAGLEPQYSPKYADQCRILAYDIDEIGNPLHYGGSMIQEFDIILVSNVLNVSPNDCWLERVLSDVSMALRPSGFAIVNFTIEPRPIQKVWGETNQGAIYKLESGFLSKFFRGIEYVPLGKKSSPIYCLTSPLSLQEQPISPKVGSYHPAFRGCGNIGEK